MEVLENQATGIDAVSNDFNLLDSTQRRNMQDKEEVEDSLDLQKQGDEHPDTMNCMDIESLASEAAEPGGDGGELPFSRELIHFSLFGKMPAKFKRPWNEALSARVEEVQEAFKNIPQMLYFSSSSVSLDGIGVYAAESLPKDTLLGPYLGRAVKIDQVENDQNNEWLWEVYEDTSLSYFIDARDPKYGNWMNFIQCARSYQEQNLRMAQYNNHLYFVVTSDIHIREELLVWYDEEQYDVYMGVPTGFREIPPPPLYLEQQTLSQDSSRNATFTYDGSKLQPGASPLHDPPPPPPLPPSYPSCCSNNGGSNFSDSASTDDSGISLSMETISGGLISGGPTSGGPTSGTPLQSSYEVTVPHHITSPNKDSKMDGESDNTETVTTGAVSFPSPSNGRYHHQYVGMESERPEHLQWYETPSLPAQDSTSPHDIAKLGASKTPDCSSAHTPTEGAESWGGATQENSTGLMSSFGLIGLTNGKNGLLYGLFSRSEDGSRWHCEECKRLFSSQGSLRAHARIHTGERPYQCQYCFRAFCQASTLRSHERLHTGEKPYKCEDCGRAFTQSAGLRSHRKTHRYNS